MAKAFAGATGRMEVNIYSDQKVLEFGLGCVKLEMPMSDM